MNLARRVPLRYGKPGCQVCDPSVPMPVSNSPFRVCSACRTFMPSTVRIADSLPFVADIRKRLAKQRRYAQLR